MCKVSVIMPVYNSEEYLSHAVESVLAQDFDSFELILSDDGSTDGSGALCDSFAKQDERVHVIHKENGGICSARNAALAIARGEYVTFCDNDDEFLPGLLADNYALAKEHNAELVRFAIIRTVIKEDGSKAEYPYAVKDEVLKKSEFAEHFRNVRKGSGVWSALFRRDIIEKYNLKFDERFKHGQEDVNYSLRFLMHTNKLALNSKHYYVWYQRAVHSTSRKFYAETLADTRRNFNLEYKLIKDVCGDRVPTLDRYTFCVNDYIYPLIEYTGLKSCTLSKNEKLKELRWYRNHPMFEKEMTPEEWKRLKKENFRAYITLKLFMKRLLKLELLLIGTGTKVLNRFRFK